MRNAKTMEVTRPDSASESEVEVVADRKGKSREVVEVDWTGKRRRAESPGQSNEEEVPKAKRARHTKGK